MKFRVDLKIFAFIILFFLTHQIEIYALIMVFATIHEIAHLETGVLLKFKPEKLELVPLGLTVSFQINLDEYNQKINKANCFEIKKIIIAVAGPIINFIIAILFSNFHFWSDTRNAIIYANLLIAFFNMLPIYPLDGGRILKGILHIIFGRWKARKYINDISMILVIILTAIASIGIYYYKNIAFLIIITYLWVIVLKEDSKYKKQRKIYNVIKTLENNKKK